MVERTQKSFAVLQRVYKTETGDRNVAHTPDKSPSSPSSLYSDVETSDTVAGFSISSSDSLREPASLCSSSENWQVGARDRNAFACACCLFRPEPAPTFTCHLTLWYYRMTPSFEKKTIEIVVVLENNVASEIFIKIVLAPLRDILCALRCCGATSCVRLCCTEAPTKQSFHCARNNVSGERMLSDVSQWRRKRVSWQMHILF